MLLLAAVVTVLVIAMLASAAAWAIGAHLNASLRAFSSVTPPVSLTGRPTRLGSRSRIVLPSPLD